MAAPLANMVAIPAVTLLIVPLTLIGSALLFVSLAFSAGCWTLAAMFWQWMWQWLEVLDKWLPPLGLLYQPSPALLFLSLLGIALVLSPLRAPRWCWLPGLCILYLLAPQRPLRHGEFELHMLDVGQGLSLVVVTANHTQVYDAGAKFPDGGDMGSSVVVPYLRSQGIRRIDHLVISHGDLDHAGGAMSLAQALPVTRLLSSDVQTLRRVPAARRAHCRQQQRWTRDGVVFELLYAFDTVSATDNDRSCLLRIRGRYGSALLTGDIGQAAERALLQRRTSLAATLLVVPHHGSHTSSSASFIAAVAPRYALFSAGYRNRFNHPAPAVLDRYRRAGVACFESAYEGTVRVRFTARHPVLQAMRRADRRYWDPA
jgi:competence protein ComEC